MKVKIVSNGIAHATKVIDQETGQVLENVKSVRWEADPRRNDGYAVATIEIFAVPVEVEVEDAEIERVDP